MMLFLAAIQAVAFLLFIAPKAGAQSQLPQGLIDGIGTPCLLSLSSLLSNDDLNKCLQLNEAITTFGAVKSNDSLVPALNTFLTQDFCPADACQQSTLTSANDTLYQSCTSDIESGKNPILKLLPAFLKDYTPIKTATCLQDTKANDQNCIVQTLTNVEQSSQTNISINYLNEIASATPSSSNDMLTKLTQNKTLLCTDCNYAVDKTLLPAARDILNASTVDTLQSEAQKQCNVNLTQGDIPETIKNSANSNSSDDTDSASNEQNASGGSDSSSSLHVSVKLCCFVALVATSFVSL